VTGLALFQPLRTCWICESPDLHPVHELIFELAAYTTQDPQLAAYSGQRLPLCRCGRCGFAQPGSMPALPRYFDRMYDQRWSADWIRSEFESGDKDFIFHEILGSLAQRLPAARRRLLDVGAHAGRFVWLASAAGWAAEGLELNPQTASYAAARTGASIRQMNVQDVDMATAAYDAITITDVLEHIPDPVPVLARAAALLAPGGWIAVKVPCGPSQLLKERVRGRLFSSYRPTVADNLVHVSHFSAGSLRRALERAGFDAVSIEPGAPELHGGSGASASGARAGRRTIHRLARLLPGGVHLPITFNLQAYARRA
jgi:SAM-dependent methyltransferase